MRQKDPTSESAQVAVAVTAVALILLLGKLGVQAYFPTLNFDGAS